MIKLGHTNRLLIKRIGAYNIYLDGGDSGEVMLTDSAIEEPAVGDELDVFVYKDADETLVATTNLPRVVAGACASMSVVALTDNCLLYTSPSPRDKRQSRMPSSA